MKCTLSVNLKLFLSMGFDYLFLALQTHIVQMLPNWLMHLSSQFSMFISVIIVVLFNLLLLRSTTRLSNWRRRIVMNGRLLCPWTVYIINTWWVFHTFFIQWFPLWFFIKRIMLLGHFVDSLPIWLEKELAVSHDCFDELII